MTEKSGSISLDVNLDLAPLKRTLKNLLAAVDASEKGIDLDGKEIAAMLYRMSKNGVKVVH